jgi:hypothetical protein
MRNSLALSLTVLLACNGGGREETDTAIDTTTLTGTTLTTTSIPTTSDTSVPTSGTSDSVGTGTGVDSIGTTTMGTGETTDPTTATTGNDQGMIVSIEIEPLDAVITIVDGQIPAPTEYKAIGVTDKGEKVPVQGTWDYDRPDLAGIGDQSGLLGATGLGGGKGNVSFDGAGDLPKVSTTASVKLVFNADPDGIPPAIKDQFPLAVDPDPAMTLLYPYDKTVFPRGLTGPVIQWNGGGPNDIYYIHAYSEFFEYKGWHHVPPPSRFSFPAMPADIWLKLTASTDGPVQLDIARHDGAKAYVAQTQTWTIAPANLTGAVYYWEVNNGKVVRLTIGQPAPQQFVQSNRCTACHSVSKDGSRIAASFDGGASPWTAIDAATGAVLYDSNQSSGFEAISPNGSHIVWGSWIDGAFNSQGQLYLSTYNNTAPLAALVPGAPGAPSHPVWAGDVGKIAFAMRTNGNGLDFTTSSLWLTDVDIINPGFSNPHQIVAANELTTTTFPTFSPDSQWIAFMRANQARTRGAVAEVWLTNLDGSAVTRLDRANGKGIIEPGQDQTSYEPTFLPVSVGGYYWLIIGSERKYGNTLTDTAPATRRKQLWVTAIDANVQPGVDPSHPAFWLPGQELNNSNMRGEWALSPCKQNGDSCNAGFDCCDGFCYGEPATCSDKPDTCSHIGDSCMADSDCCADEGTCIGGYCSIMPG